MAAPALDLEAIRRRLPHRYPFLLLDRVLELDARHVIAVKNVTANEPYFAGHFPGVAIMPAVLILEGMAQAVGLMHQESYPSGLGYLVGIDEARVRRMVVPGDRLTYAAEVERARGRLCRARARASVDGESVAEAVIQVMADDGQRHAAQAGPTA